MCNNKKIEVGFAPQTLVTDPELIEKLEEIAKTQKPTGSWVTLVPNNNTTLSEKEKFEQLVKLAENGNPEAQNDLGVAYIRGDYGVDIDEKKAVELFNASLKNGFPLAVANLGRCSLEGKGVCKDNTLNAIMFMGFATLLGVSIAEIELIKNVDLKELIECANSENAYAQYFLGLCYALGYQVEKDTDEAFVQFEKAAKQNNPLALIALSKCVSTGVGFKKDPYSAISILNSAAEYAYKEVGRGGYETVMKEKRKIQDSIPYLLLKVIPICESEGQPEDKYVTDFLNGKLFMKTLEQFADFMCRDESSDNNFRGDIHEGIQATFTRGYNPMFYQMDKNEEIMKTGICGVIDVLKLRIKVFCMTAIDYHEAKNAFILPDKRMQEFGKYSIIITDVPEFLKRVKDAFEKLNNKDKEYILKYKKVRYDMGFEYEDSYDEFHKNDSYSYQNEFRISIDFTEGKFSQKILDTTTDFAKITFPGKIQLDTNELSLSETFFLQIGDIRDISKVFNTTDFMTGKVDFDLKNIPQSIEPLDPKTKPRPTFFKEILKK